MTTISPDLATALLFTLNILLIVLDASLGYHLAPRLVRLPEAEDPALRETMIRTVRRMLTLLVALYMFFNCLGYFNGSTAVLLIVTALVVCDLGGQLYLRRRTLRGGGAA